MRAAPRMPPLWVCVGLAACWAWVAHPAAAFSPGCTTPARTSCNCSPSGDHELICFVDNNQLLIRLFPPRYYSIDCQRVHSNFDYRKLPRFTLGGTAFHTVAFRNCPLPSISFGEIISSLGVTRATAVDIDSFDRSISSIERKHLAGLEELKTTRLTLSNIGLRDLPKDLFADMGNLTWLSLRTNNVRLPVGFFEHLTKLEILELSDNHLTDIEEDMLSHLSSLKKLYLWHNNIHTLTKPVFKHLTELRELDMSGNNLTELPEEIFQHLEKLSTISLYANNFTALPRNIFSDNKELKTVYLHNNNVNLTALPEYFLSDMEQLRDVELYRIGLETIPDNAFLNSSGIINLTLADNNIATLPETLFRNQVNMVKLDLSNNRLRSLPNTLFMTQENLEYLDLSHNLIENITSNLFESLTKLKSLKMRQNRLTRIGSDVFTLTTSIVYVDMSHNMLHFEELPLIQNADYEDSLSHVSPFQKIVNLRWLDLGHNRISDMCSDWRISLMQLEYLNLSHNRITNIDYTNINFLGQKLLVDLTHNNISNINFSRAELEARAAVVQQPDARSALSQPPHDLRVLVGHNPFACDCFLTHFVQYIKDELDEQVRANVNVDVSDAICASSPPGTDLTGKHLKSLRPQDLLCPLDNTSSGEPKMCPDACNCFVRLYDRASIQECTGGAVDAVPHIPNVKELGLNYTELHLENNGLSRIIRNGDMPETVTKLYLNNNNLTELSVGDIPNDIQVLNLKNNNLVHLNASIAEMVVNGSRLKELWLGGNPLACDCENTVFLGLVQKHRFKVHDYEDLVCPDGKSIKYLAVGGLCGTPPGLVGASVVIALLGLLTGLAAAVYYKYNHEIKVYLFARGLCLWFVQEEELDKDKLYDAFVSFSYKDEEFVVNKLIAPLEKYATPFKLCVHFRDWIAGEVIPEQIVKSVKDSRRTIVVLSPNFIDSVWGRMEFRTAHSQALQEGRARVIVVVLGDIDVDKLDDELKAYLATNTYVKWGDPWFWDKLKYALPHPSHRLSRNVTHASVTKKKGFDDRLELIHPASPTTPPALNTPPAHQANAGFVASPQPSLATKFPAVNGHANGSITMNGLRVNGNAKHSEV